MAGNITAGVAHAFRTVLLNICEEIYSLMIFCFEIFEQFGKLRVLENQVGFIFQKVSFVLGLFMVFRLSFAAIEYVINPDNMLDKTKGIGNVVKKVLIVIVLLGSTHFLFDFAYEANNALIDNQIIGKILLSTPDSEYQSDGSEIAWNIFNAFFTINYDAVIDKDRSEVANCIQYFEDDTFRTDLVVYHNMSHAFGCVNITDGEDNGWTFIRDESLQGNYIVNFHGILALAAGLVMLWIIVLYTIQLGIRAIQLAYLELIAPIPIMMYLMPKGEDKLGKWGQQCLTTFLDFFIRLAIIDFIVLLSSELIKSMTDESGEFFATFAEVTTNWAGTTYILVVMIVALFMFARRIPKLLGEIFPTMGGAASLGFGIGIPNELRQLGHFSGNVASGVVGGAVGGATNAVISGIDNFRAAGRIGRNRLGAALHGLGSGALIGIRNGARGGNIFHNFAAGMAERREADRNYEQLLSEGGSARGRITSQITGHFGMTRGQELERMRSNAARMDEYVNNINSAIDSVDAVSQARAAWENFAPTANMTYEQAEMARNDLMRIWRETRNRARDLALGNVDLNTIEDASENDILHLTEARQQARAANAFADAVNAQYIDTDGEQHDFTRITDSASLGRVSFEANSTETMITGSEEYIRSTANDRAAGVNGNGNNN